MRYLRFFLAVVICATFVAYAVERPAPPDSARADTLLSPAEEHIARGNAYSDKKDYDSAIASYTEAIRLDSGNKVAYKKRGNAYLDKDAYDSAIADFTAAIRIDSNYAVAYYNRGGAYFNKDAYDSAIADFTQAIRLDSNDADTYCNRGRAYSAKAYKRSVKSGYDLGIADFTESIRLAPDSADTYYYRGAAYFEKGKYDSAITDYTTAIRLKPNDTLSYYYRGYTYLEKGENDSAIADYTVAIGLDPNNANAYHNRGFAYNKRGRHLLALVDYAKEIMLDPIRGLPEYCVIFTLILVVYLIVRFVKKHNSTWWSIIKKAKKLLWGYGLVISGFMVRVCSDADTDVKRTLILMFILSAGVFILYLVGFFKNAAGWVASGIKGLIACIEKSIVEVVWVFILVFSGTVFYAWFIGYQLDHDAVTTWRNYFDIFSAVTLFAVLLIVLRTVYIVKKINGKRVGVNDNEAV